MSAPAALAPAVYFVGAGPGDPELLALKAKRTIDRADVIVYADSLVPPQIFADARADAERVRTGSLTLEAIVPLMIDRVRAGLSVARVHSGDLTLYSAVHEQTRALAKAGVSYELIPGISAFQDAAAKLGVELTVPELVQTIILTRPSGRASAVPAAEELSSLAAHRASLALYLAARHVETAQAQLLLHYPADTPVAICYRLGWPDEKIRVTSLAHMAAVSQLEQFIRTTLYLISPALNGLTAARSHLYHPQHAHLFRPAAKTGS
ncbi:precorrin-4 C11-methyltransferase [Rubidibacter lacunae KORDI 51-2]|uniref:Precorrin-4 C11-methyltransferase n=1 Tax=Rubidibacter lacunae KORDI 51-2 TaxID=582515 RepID=U5DEM6_9CHRO|nr:precorrin-4 C(11)-methyltransferase [Rubidibacter lacunae]ERN42953.1 precorrin-4 C11-methyltransferase [Rubidibacter lacunae KORDI 51-2]